MDTVGKRLREERLRVGLSQDEFAAIGGLGRKSLGLYESDERAPDTNFLLALRGIGVDVWYVLTGQTLVDSLTSEESELVKRCRLGKEAQTSGSELTQDEREILDAYNQLNEAGKATMQAMLETWVNTGALTQTGQPPAPERRVKRLSENRRAALDARAAENVERAMQLVAAERAERSARSKKGPGK
ncbi:helix-turn-helix transcriptional regulator [Trinickia terrae]|uniref:Helix-turn-helix transcriptional regulator n=1 Tax=Trinickia terrae TaxID=2571161 RepID=A0A4U1HTT9_9BURK|nr:helix-turn-helix transcriptional regulator [Trinickia terrae]TKC83447.1 helix-turn-helix transcriptional regulator [Trinickia terrae]